MAAPLVARRCLACGCTGFTPHPSAPSVCMMCSHESAHHEGATSVPSATTAYGVTPQVHAYSASPYSQVQPAGAPSGYSPYGSVPPTAPTAVPVASRLCAFPGCAKSPYVEPSGRTHPYCGATHAQQYAQLYGGMPAQASAQPPPAPVPMTGYPAVAPPQPAYSAGQPSLYSTAVPPSGPAPTAPAYPQTGYPGHTPGYW